MSPALAGRPGKTWFLKDTQRLNVPQQYLNPRQVVTIATKLEEGVSKQVGRESTKAQLPIRLREGSFQSLSYVTFCCSSFHKCLHRSFMAFLGLTQPPDLQYSASWGLKLEMMGNHHSLHNSPPSTSGAFPQSLSLWGLFRPKFLSPVGQGVTQATPLASRQQNAWG